MIQVYLTKADFKECERTVAKTNGLHVTTSLYKTNIESLKIHNSKGYVEVLPYMGQIIWDLNFNNTCLKLHNIFDMPREANTIIDTYGCFAFHSGLLANGCPSPEDNHPMHGEFSVAKMDDVYLEITEDSIKVVSVYHYCKGFGFNYIAKPSVTLKKDETNIEIKMEVTNLTATKMPLQYMCHMNYAYFDDAIISSNISDSAFKLRTSIPSHVHPTEKWLAYNEKLKELEKEGKTLSILNNKEFYDPEIVFMADNLQDYEKHAVFEMTNKDNQTMFSEFSTLDFNSATRWIMHNADLKVAAFALPATCRPEGFKAAEKANTLIYLDTNETKVFTVKTGMR